MGQTQVKGLWHVDIWWVQLGSLNDPACECRIGRTWIWEALEASDPYLYLHPILFFGVGYRPFESVLHLAHYIFKLSAEMKLLVDMGRMIYLRLHLGHVKFGNRRILYDRGFLMTHGFEFPRIGKSVHTGFRILCTLSGGLRKIFPSTHWCILVSILTTMPKFSMLRVFKLDVDSLEHWLFKNEPQGFCLTKQI